VEASQRGDEVVDPPIPAGELQLQPACVVADAGGDVEERQTETFPAYAGEGIWEGVVAQPQRDVVGGQAGLLPQCVGVEGGQGGMVERPRQ